jgi:hypothetical protein
VLADLAKEAVLDRVPFGGAGRIMTDRDAQLVGIDQFFLQSELPSPAARAKWSGKWFKKWVGRDRGLVPMMSVVSVRR